MTLYLAGNLRLGSSLSLPSPAWLEATLHSFFYVSTDPSGAKAFRYVARAKQGRTR